MATNIENLLLKAKELQGENDLEGALKTLERGLTFPRHAINHTPNHELMNMYIELCVKLLKSSKARTGLFAFRKYTSQSNTVGTLESVLKLYRELSEAQFNKVYNEADKKLSVEIDDLDAEEDPATLMLNSVKSSNAFTDKEKLIPSIKFLWEAYKNILETLKTSSKLEDFYRETIYNIFEFCREHKRRVEFKTICDRLRYHLNNALTRYSQYGTKMSDNFVSLGNQDTVLNLLQIRFKQIEMCFEFGLIQEAFKTAEDIHLLMKHTEKGAKPKTLAQYYECLAKIFWDSDYYLYHAYACLQYFNLARKSKKQITPDELRSMATKVVLATLAVPTKNSTAGGIGSLNVVSNDEKIVSESFSKIAKLLGSSVIPSRENLIRDLKNNRTLEHALPGVKELFNLLESEFSPLNLSKKATPQVKVLDADEDLKKYVKAINKLIMVRILEQLSVVYKTISLKKFCNLLDVKEFTQIETMVVECAKHGIIKVKIDYLRQALVFGAEGFETTEVSGQLANIAHKLVNAIHLITPTQTIVQEDRAKKVQKIQMLLPAEIETIRRRKHILEKRKVEVEEEQKKLSQDKKKQEDEERRVKEAEERVRQQKEAVKRYRERLEAELEGLKLEETKIVLEELQTRKAKIKIDGKIRKAEELTPMALMKGHNAESIVEVKQKHLSKEKEDFEKKMAQERQKLDHLVRAFREEEKTILKGHLEEHAADELANLKSIARKKYDEDVKTKEMLTPIDTYKTNFLATLKDQRQTEFEEKMSEYRNAHREMIKDNIIKNARDKMNNDMKRQELDRARAALREEQMRRYASNREKSPEEMDMTGLENYRDDDEDEPSSTSAWRRDEPVSRPGFTNTRKTEDSGFVSRSDMMGSRRPISDNKPTTTGSRWGADRSQREEGRGETFGFRRGGPTSSTGEGAGAGAGAGADDNAAAGGSRFGRGGDSRQGATGYTGFRNSKKKTEKTEKSEDGWTFVRK